MTSAILAALALTALLTGCTAAPPVARPAPAPVAVAGPAVEPLPTDPALVTGTAASGLRYMVRRHPNPAGRAAFWLHVAAGSLDEADDTRGLAHYLEHMAFNGSANFPPGALIPYFESLGLAFGRDQNAFTSLGQTVYQIAVPDVKAETLGKALLYLGDVATRMLLTPEEIERERQIILEEKRVRAGADQRVRDQVLERLAPGSTFGLRLPIGTEEAIRSVMPRHFREFYARHYVPANMTLIAACDCEPALVVEQIHKEFDGAPRAPRPPPRTIVLHPTVGVRGVVATDRDLERATVSLTRVEPSHPPTTTVGEVRRDLLESLATRAFNRRLGARLAAGSASYLEASAQASDWAGAARLVSVRAAGLTDRWRAMLDELAAAVQQARIHGFAEREIDILRRAMLSEAEDAVQRQATRPARTVLRQLNDEVARREPSMSAEQRRAVLQRLLPGIDAAEVSRAFAATFDFTNVVVAATLPAAAGVPDDAALAQAGRQALLARVEAPTDLPVETRLLETPPAPGRIVERGEHTASGVTSVWLANGVRVHHRFVDQRRNEARVRITLAGGEIEETAANRGVTRAAALAWQRPATSTLTSTQVRDLMTGRRVHVGGAADADALQLVVSGDPAELEHGLQLAYRLLTDPVVEPAALAQWQETELQAITARRTRPAGVLGEALADAIYPATELRTRSLSAEQVRAVSREAASAWLTRLVATAPIEVAVVGDLERERALELVTRYVGALPARARIGADTGPAGQHPGRPDRHPPGGRPRRLLRRRPRQRARHPAAGPGRPRALHAHEPGRARGAPARLQHLRQLPARRRVPGLRAVRGPGADRPRQDRGADRDAGGDVHGLRPVRPQRGRDPRGARADRQRAGRGAGRPGLLERSAGQSRLPRHPAGRHHRGPAALRRDDRGRGAGGLRPLLRARRARAGRRHAALSPARAALSSPRRPHP
jgi:zinc protease